MGLAAFTNLTFPASSSDSIGIKVKMEQMSRVFLRATASNAASLQRTWILTKWIKEDVEFALVLLIAVRHMFERRWMVLIGVGDVAELMKMARGSQGRLNK